jgi:hypothetical protein
MNDPEIHATEDGITIDSTASEVHEEPIRQAATGETLPAPTATAGAFIDMVEDGEFSRELHEQLKELARETRAIAERIGKAKGKLKVEFDLEYQDGQFKIDAKYEVKPPKLPRQRSVAWLDHDDNFVRFPPNQHQMFGPRPVRAVTR